MRLEGYELLKAFAGNQTHEMSVDVPVLPNSQDMQVLSAQEAECLWLACLVSYEQKTELPEAVHPLMWRVLLWECPASPVLH